jgi:hypothetical protein
LPETDNGFFNGRIWIDNLPDKVFLTGWLAMNTVFAKQLKMTASVTGCTAIWTRGSYHFGSGGRKF